MDNYSSQNPNSEQSYVRHRRSSAYSSDPSQSAYAAPAAPQANYTPVSQPSYAGTPARQAPSYTGAPSYASAPVRQSAYDAPVRRTAYTQDAPAQPGAYTDVRQDVYTGASVRQASQAAQRTAYAQSASTPPVSYAAPSVTVVNQTPSYAPDKYGYTGDPRFRPMSPWAYFGLSLLFAVPIVGLVFLIIFSFKSTNINRRCFARSFWCGLLISAIVLVAAYFILAASGVAIFQSMNSVRYY